MPTLADIILGEIKAEGGYVNNLLDRGGSTNFGVTQRSYDAYCADLKFATKSVSELTQLEAYNFYLKVHASDPHIDKLMPLSPLLMQQVFSWGITSGTKNAIQGLQRALNGLSNGAWPFLNVDGGLGDITLGAAQTAYNTGKITLVANMVQSLRSVFYLSIGERDKSQLIFELGWQRRVFNTFKE